MAHPDDEIIFGFPVLKETSKITICSSDLNNPDRTWCKDRKKALKEVCNELKIEYECLDYNSDFYSLETRNETLKKMLEDVRNRITGKIFTHNPWGEYGHIDHILIHLLAKQITDIYYSDIAIESNWMPIKPFESGTKIKEVENDLELYNKCKDIYKKYGVWTWDRDPILKTTIYENRNSR